MHHDLNQIHPVFETENKKVPVQEREWGSLQRITKKGTIEVKVQRHRTEEQDGKALRTAKVIQCDKETIKRYATKCTQKLCTLVRNRRRGSERITGLASQLRRAFKGL